PFVQLHPMSDRAQGGLGIGLTLVRRLVELHEGSVTAYSEGKGKGSEFIVRLPLLADPPSPYCKNLKIIHDESPLVQKGRLYAAAREKIDDALLRSQRD